MTAKAQDPEDLLERLEALQLRVGRMRSVARDPQTVLALELGQALLEAQLYQVNRWRRCEQAEQLGLRVVRGFLEGEFETLDQALSFVSTQLKEADLWPSAR